MVDEVAKDRDRFTRRSVPFCQSLVDLRHFGAVALARLRMDGHRSRFFATLKFGVDPVLLCLQLGELTAKCFPVGMAIHDHLEHVLDLALDRTQLARQVIPPPMSLLGKSVTLDPVGLDRLADDVGCQQELLQRRQHPLLDVCRPDSPAVCAAV